MKYFSERDIRKLSPVKLLIEEIENFYINRTDTIIPERIHLDDGNNTVLIMPAFDSHYYAVKLVGVAPNNRDIDKPFIHGTVILHNRKTLEPLGFFDGQSITAVRTGAIGGLSIKYLSKKDASSIGIIGTGVQGWSHLEAALSVRDIRKVFLYNRNVERLELFKERAKSKFPYVEIIPTTKEKLVENSDIIITTTTSLTPVLPDLEPKHWKGKHIVAVGSFKPTMQELPDNLLGHANPLYIDTLTALTESGDMIKAREIQCDHISFYTLKDIIEQKITSSDYTVFKSVGMSLFDLITTRLIYERNFQNI